MTMIRVVHLACDAPGCEARWTGPGNQNGWQTRQEAAQCGWSMLGTHDRCPEHPRPLKPERPPRTGTLIRLYNRRGRLLYIAGTRGEVRIRLRALKAMEPWYVDVDHSRTLVDILPPGDDLTEARAAAIAREHPMHHLDKNGNRPYLHHTKRIPPERVTTPLSRLQERRSS